MIETNYKQTPIGKIPKEWEVVKLQEIFKLRNGERPIFSKNGKYLVYGANGVMGLTNDFLVDNDFTIIFGRVGASGEIHIASGKAWVSDNAIYSKDYDRRRVHPYFTYYLLKWKNLKQFATKTTHPIITQTFLNSLKIPLPPLPEQKAIAKVLSTIDEAIQKVDEAIAKTERLKKGLMQKLLTRGIGHKEFKYSKELGCEIPKEWKVVKIKEVAIDIQPGFACGKRDENGVIQLRMNNVTTDGRILLDNYIKVPPPPEINKYLLKKGDILFNNTNSVELVGKTAVVNEDIKNCTFSNHFTRIRVKGNIVLPNWIKYYFIRKWEKGYFKQICRRHVHQAGIGKNAIENIKIPLPPLSEQKKIAEILATVDKKLELERKRKEKLERVKKGLMNDLLTGRKRVNVEKVLGGENGRNK